MANLFKKAAKTATKSKSQKDKKVRIRIEDPTFFDKIEKLEQLNDTLKSAQAKADILSDEIKEISRNEWAKMYNESGKNPGTVMVENVNELDQTAQVMFTVQDKYISINEERAEWLTETYGEEIVEQETTFSFDSNMIEKYGEVLSRLIEESLDIEESDKEKIIKATTKFSVKKGTVDIMNKFGDVSDFMQDVRPIAMLRGAEVVR